MILINIRVILWMASDPKQLSQTAREVIYKFKGSLSTLIAETLKRKCLMVTKGAVIPKYLRVSVVW